MMSLRQAGSLPNDGATPFPLQNLPFGIFRRPGRPSLSRRGRARRSGDRPERAERGELLIRACGSGCPCVHAASVERLLRDGRRCMAGAAACAVRPVQRAASSGHAGPVAGYSSGASCRKPMWNTACRRGSATTRISIRRSITRATSSSCCARTARWRRTSNGCPSRTTGVSRASESPVSRCGGRSASACGGPRSARGRAVRAARLQLELGIFIGVGNEQGTRIPVGSAEQHVFGLACSTTGRRAYPGVGVGPLRSVPREEFRHYAVAMDRHDGSLAPYRAAWGAHPTSRSRRLSVDAHANR